MAWEARRKTGLSTSRVEVLAGRQNPASTHKGRVEVPGIPRRCAGGVPGKHHQLGREPYVEASRASAGGSRHPTSRSPRWSELAGFCFARAAK